jgi:phosphocarrier protein HPr
MDITFTDGGEPVLPDLGRVHMKIIEKLPVLHRLGLHLRAGAELTKVAGRFKSDIQVSNGYRSVSGKSLLDLLTLGAIYGTLLEFSAEGEDAPQAIRAIRELLDTWKEKRPI